MKGDHLDCSLLLHAVVKSGMFLPTFQRNFPCPSLVKVKWSRYRSGVAQRVGRGIALLFHDRGTRRGWVVGSMPRPHFTPGNDPVPIVQEAGWAPGSVWTGGKSRSHRDSIPDRPARSQSLYRLSYPAHVHLWYTCQNIRCYDVRSQKADFSPDKTFLLVLVRNDVIRIATRYGMNGPGIESRWEREFSSPVQTCPAAHQASCTVGTGFDPRW